MVGACCCDPNALDDALIELVMKSDFRFLLLLILLSLEIQARAIALQN